MRIIYRLKTLYRTYTAESIISLFLVLTVFFVFAQLLGHDFILQWDDSDYVVQNEHVRGGLSWDGLQWALTSRYHSQWHPLTWLSHMADVEFFGTEAKWHHLTSLLLHLLTSLLFFFFLAGTTRAPLRSGMAAVLFALHPLHVEPVAMVAFRKDLLCGLFWMLCLHAYVEYCRNGGVWRYFAVVALFILGLMSKAVIVTLPLILLCLDYWPLRRFAAARGTAESGRTAGYGEKSRQSLIFEKAALVLPMAVIAVVAIIARNPDKSLLRLPTMHHIDNGLVSYVLYLSKTLLPVNLAAIYPAPAPFPPWQVAGAGILLLLLTWYVFARRRHRPYLMTGWLWYAAGLLPVIGILGFMGPHTSADRYMYIPVAGLIIMLVWGGYDLMARGRLLSKLLKPAAVSLVVACMLLSWLQAGSWKNGERLFSHALRVTSGNHKAHHNLAMTLQEQGRTVEAVDHLRLALRIRPSFLPSLLALGTLSFQRGDFQQAERYLSEAVGHFPDLREGRYQLGLIMAGQGRLAEAEHHLQIAVLADPKNAAAFNLLGKIHLRLGRRDEAIDAFSRTFQLNPYFPEIGENLSRARRLGGP